MAKLTTTQLTKELRGGQVAPVYYFTGDDIYRKLEFVKKIKETVKPDDFNFIREDSSTADMGELLALANTAPVFSQRRLITLNNADKLKKPATEALSAYLSAPLDTTCFVILHNDAKKLKKDNLLGDSLTDNSISVDFKELKDAQLSAWIEEKIKEKGLKIDAAALIMLEELIGGDLLALNTEIEKLSIYLQEADDKTIKSEDVLSSIGFSKEENPFALSNAILGGDKALSLKLVDTMLAAGEEPVAMLSKISSCAVKMLRIKRLTSAGLSSQAVLSSGGLMPWEGRLVARAAYMPPQKTLVKVLDKIIEADMAFKTSSATQPAILLKGIILTLLSK
ncbi:MAG: DNA polymerase III subunit delta [Elusimicrobiota bacterium]|jgi:DNA polymerase-3 subunit delta|nr:DNA polymerase III subunit delta [Elusimicrobiota bacterium]